MDQAARRLTFAEGPRAWSSLLGSSAMAEVITPRAVSEINFRTQGLAPPSSVYIGPSDFLTVVSYNSFPALTVNIAGQVMKASGEIVDFTRAHVPNTDRTVKRESFNLGESFLLNLQITPSSSSVLRGMCYVIITVTHGESAASRYEHTVLIQGYVGDNQFLFWPWGKSEGSLEGPGRLRAILGTDPAAGAEILESVPTGARWRLQAFSATLVTDGTAVNRLVHFRIRSSLSIIHFQVGSTTAQGASTTVRHSGGAGAGYAIGIDSTRLTFGLPTPLMLFAGWEIATDVLNIQAGDNWGAPSYAVEEWIET